MNVQPDHTITEVTRMRNGNFCSTTYRKKLNAGENLIPSLVQPGILSLGFLAGLASWHSMTKMTLMVRVTDLIVERPRKRKNDEATYRLWLSD